MGVAPGLSEADHGSFPIAISQFERTDTKENPKNDCPKNNLYQKRILFSGIASTKPPNRMMIPRAKNVQFPSDHAEFPGIRIKHILDGDQGTSEDQFSPNSYPGLMTILNFQRHVLPSPKHFISRGEQHRQQRSCGKLQTGNAGAEPWVTMINTHIFEKRTAIFVFFG